MITDLLVSKEIPSVTAEDVIPLSSLPILLLGFVFVYSLLVAAVLPLPAEAHSLSL